MGPTERGIRVSKKNFKWGRRVLDSCRGYAAKKLNFSWRGTELLTMVFKGNRTCARKEALVFGREGKGSLIDLTDVTLVGARLAHCFSLAI